MERKEDTPVRKTRRKYEEKNKEKRKHYGYGRKKRRLRDKLGV